MIRPDEIVTAVGGRVMEGAGVEYLQNARIGQDNPSSFVRGGPAWTRQQRDRWVQVSSQQPRYGLVRVKGELRLALTLESSGGNALRFSSVISSTVASSTGAAIWVKTSTADVISTGAASMLQGQNAFTFRNGGGSTGHGIYQDMTTPTSRWAVLSAMVEELDSTGFSMRLEGSTSGTQVMNGQLGWDGTFTATGSTGASTLAPVYGQVERLGLGPNGGRAYRVTMGARLESLANMDLRATLFPAGTVASTRATYLHHAQFTDKPGGREVMVRPSTAAAIRPGERLRLLGVNMPGGAMTMYQETIAYDRPGGGAQPVALSSDASAIFFAIARGWESTDGKNYVGGAIYNRDGTAVVVGSTQGTYQPGQRLEQLARLSTDGILTYQVRVDGGPVYTAVSTGSLVPEHPARVPSYAFEHDQVLLLNVLARGAHKLDDFRALFP